MTNTTPSLRVPSALLPVAMSLVALALVVGRIVAVGVTREVDEGALAHTWQILIAAQIPIMAWFAIRYLPRMPARALPVLALQVIALLAACAPVFILRW